MNTRELKVGDKVRIDYRETGTISFIDHNNIATVSNIYDAHTNNYLVYERHIYTSELRLLEEFQQSLCNHKWVEVGFNHTKVVCYYCDKEKA